MAKINKKPEPKKKAVKGKAEIKKKIRPGEAKKALSGKKAAVLKKEAKKAPAVQPKAKSEEKIEKAKEIEAVKTDLPKEEPLREIPQTDLSGQETASLIVSERTLTKFGLIEPRPIVEEMEKSYLEYAMSVIVSRALPDVRDGLKPVHRKILYSMWTLGLRANAKFRKSATVVGEVLGKYHPHGDAAVYDSMVRMAQDFAMRYPLVRGQGNYGSMDGDNAAAMRYTEAKLAAISEEMIFDIDKNTVDFIPNFDGTQREPAVLPAKLPQLLMNGVKGIAVGMATNIPPHNLRELADGIFHLIDNPDAGIEDLMQFVKGPDFPTGGIIYSKEDILQTYATGRGSIIMRGIADITETKSGNFQIVITQIPYQVNKAGLVEKIADLVKNKKLEGIRDLRDESDKDGVRIVIDLKKDAYPKKILNSLYKATPLQESFPVNMLALMDGIQPRVMNLKIILEEHIKHRETVVERRTAYELEKAKERAHILEGLLIALAKIDEVIRVIKKSKDRDEAKINLIKKFKLTERQSIAILDMRLATLANLERLKIETEHKDKKKLIKELEEILKSRKKILSIVRSELKDIVEKFGDERRTRVIEHGVKEFKMEDLVPNEENVVLMTRDGYIKRLLPETFKTQARGGKGVLGLSTKEEDTVEFLFTSNTHNDVLFFTTMGRVFQLKIYEIPQAARTAKGQAIVNFLQLSSEEQITSILPLDKIGGSRYLFFATEKGLVKKVLISAFANVRRSGLISIKMKEGDRLIWAKPTSGRDHIQLITASGQAIRFKETDVRDMGRTASGVHGIRLKKEDLVVGMGVVSTDKDIVRKYQVLTVMEKGFGKRTALGNYKVQGRGGSGIKTAKVTSKTGKIVNAFIINKEIMTGRDLIIISEKGQVIRLPFKSVPELGRDTQGVRLMRFREPEDKVGSVTWV